MKTRILTAIILFLTAFLFVRSQIENRPFAAAADFPRGALIYAQTSDLPTFIKLWNESKFAEKYLESESFKDLQKRHLGLKLASRLREFNAAAGFDFDLESLAGLTENQAAIAVYDIGKLDFVLIAPISEEVFAATAFARNETNFAAETLADGTEIYRANVEADRGRQKQELIFSYVKGKFILATSEKLIAQTLTNIGGKKGKNSLADEPDFKTLTEKFVPQTATIWVNQTALNDDYYFKRYQLMSETAELENIRAGIFDFAATEGKLIERRKFLLARTVEAAKISAQNFRESLEFLPENIPLYRMQSVNRKTTDNAIQNTVFGRATISEAKPERQIYYSSFDDDWKTTDFTSLGEDFDSRINETEDVEKPAETGASAIDFAAILQSAEPQTALTLTEPEILPAPQFVEFRRGAILTFAAPEKFDRAAFESAIAEKIWSQMTAADGNFGQTWQTVGENNFARRELNLPLTGWKAVYQIRGNKLILSNSAEFFEKIITPRNPQIIDASELPLTQLSVLNLARRENAYDDVFKRLDENNAADNFFSGNVGSFLKAAAEIKTVTVSKNYERNFLNEEIVINY